MHIRLQRLENYTTHTIGVLYIDGKLQCFTLEDEKREIKQISETRIPAGLYKLRLQTSGQLSPRYAQRFSFHKGMLHLQDVPGFEGIFIHVGNTDKDTSGCILLGASHNLHDNFIGGSTRAYIQAYQTIANAISKGEVVTIQVVDELLG